MRFRPWLVYCSSFFVAILVLNARHSSVSAQQPSARASGEASDCSGEPCGAVVRGLVGFLDRSPARLDSNGRSCADCHMPSDRFQLSPASVEARFALLQFVRRFVPRFDDPLFRLLVLRGLCWTANEPVDRLSELITVGARIEP